MKFVKEIIPYVVIIIVVVLIRIFIVTPVQVDGSSMYPTLKNNEILILKKYDKSYHRFDIVVLSSPRGRLIKRVIGLPGETIEFKNNKLYINGKYIKQKFRRNTKTSDFEKVKIPKGYYFVMGDNRDNSADSRILGPINKKDIKGTIGIRLFPFNKIGTIK
jgi:signal peptidase I